MNDPIWYPFTQMRDFHTEHPPPPLIVRGEGAYLIDAEGRRYFDAISSLWANLHGHRHPRLDAALVEQSRKIAHSTLLGLRSEAPLELARRLVEVAPKGEGENLSRVFYSDSGATAVEVALKISVQFHRVKENPEPRRTRIVAFENSYHGDTCGGVSIEGVELFRRHYTPLLFDAIFVPIDGEASALRRLLAERGEEVAAVVLEPCVQGAAGMRVQPEGFVAAVARAAREAGALFVADEVATGFGRTGRMFACEHEGVVPDLLCLGKGITGGYLPLAATLATERIFEAFLGDWHDFKHFFHGHTYTGNALASAVALASLDVFEEERTLEHIARLSEAAEAALEALRASAAGRFVREVRRKGLMVGIDLAHPDGTPFPTERRTGHRVIYEARRRGTILRPLGDTLVWMPPYCATEDEIALLGEVTAEAIEAGCGGT